MSDHDAYRDEMGRFFRMSDRDLDRLLAGKVPPGDEDLEELAAFLREVKTAHLRFPPESTEAKQLAAILEAAQLLSDKGEPAARPASKAPGPDPQASRLPTWRRKLMPSGLLSTMWSRAAVATAAAFLVCCGLAFAGALPDPLQTAAANAASEVGVSLDNPGDSDEVGDVDAVDDNDASDAADNEAKDDDDAKAADRDDGDNGDSHPVSASDDVNPPAPAVSTPQPADDNDDQGEKDDDHANSPPAADDDDNEADDDNNQADDDDNEADDDDNEADDEGAADDHEGEDQGESDD